MIRRRILVPVNFSSQSDAALHLASKLASSMNGMITCLHVNEEPDLITSKFISREINERIRRQAEEMLSVKANEIFNADNKTPFEVIITSGKVHKKIREKASDLNVDFILIGKSDSEDPGKAILGSNTTRVITKAKIPVLTVGGKIQDLSKRILLPLDLSKPIELKLAKAIEIAGLLKAEIDVLTILESDWISAKPRYQSRLRDIQEIISKEGILCSTHMKITENTNTIPDEILRHAEQTKAGIIMLMTQQERDVTEFFIGTTAQKVIHKSRIPVLSISPEVGSDRFKITSILGDILIPITLLELH